ncbi:TonB-dependent receptor [Aurantiacibacter xanthus]|uniref:TonB-dependent receptor n=1 Tax=Aurantiacibacter xanthus TaxID=1784712 RepID=A0A3A1P5I0_9SPHN|nr:TonB-dependent receptor [Aurantiacibacter xanthus]RIV81632.1 TonB-dependent receptor [Aurantiacibacter xanthus]
MKKCSRIKLKLMVATAITGTAATATPALAQDVTTTTTNDAIVVTATRRATTLMDTPINISALSGDELARQKVEDIRDIADFTPGMTISDTGPGSTGTIVLRGLRASDVGAGGAIYDNAMGIYLGEVPMYYDFKFIDIARVETLLGPQGTLYGLGTLAGAIRYIPNRPNLDKFEGEVLGGLSMKAHGDDVGFKAEGVINIPIMRDHIAFRSATGYTYDPGFIDYPLLVQEPGISIPQPGGPGNPTYTDAEYDANLYRRDNLNYERTVTTRNQLLVAPSDDISFNFTYAFQQTKTEGSQSNSNGVMGTGIYENASRYAEPVDRYAHLASVEVNANIADVVDLVATAAYTESLFTDSVDVTDLLLDLDYGYENYPGFSAYTESERRRKQHNVEVRFVSTHGGPVNWVLGGFFNRDEYQSDYAEMTPNHPWCDQDGNPSCFEYVSYISSEVKEKAIFGEATLQIIPQWQITGGARYFDYTSQIAGAATLPLLGQPLSPYDRNASGGTGGEDGWVWKLNTSFDIADELMIYGTFSKGYRIGGPNRVAPCPEGTPTDPTQYNGPQLICALPSEIQYGPDETKNLEIGARLELFDRRLNLNLAYFHIDWDGIQVASATTYGVTGITINGGKALSEGFEATFQARPIPELSIQGSFSYVDAHLTEDVPDIISVNSPAGSYPSAPIKIDALAGDRLPGSAKHSGSLGAIYTLPVGDNDLVLNWTATYRGNVVSRLGWDRASGTVIPSYTVHRASISYEMQNYTISLYANNIFDKYAVVSTANDLSQTGYNDGILLRYYRQAVLNPRTVGIEARMKF